MMPGPININRLARALYGEWNATEQPIDQRGLGLSYEPQPAPEGPMHYPVRAGQLANQFATGIINSLAPVASYEDGSMHPAWPSLLTDGVEGFNNLWDRAAIDREGLAGTFDSDLGKEAASGSLMASGLAATGGLAAGVVPENALASKAIRRGGFRSQMEAGLEHLSPDVAAKTREAMEINRLLRYYSNDPKRLQSAFLDHSVNVVRNGDEIAAVNPAHVRVLKPDDQLLEGETLTHHGTPGEAFPEVDFDKVGKTDYGWLTGPAYYSSPDPSYASHYAKGNGNVVRTAVKTTDMVGVDDPRYIASLRSLPEPPDTFFANPPTAAPFSLLGEEFEDDPTREMINRLARLDRPAAPDPYGDPLANPRLPPRDNFELLMEELGVPRVPVPPMDEDHPPLPEPNDTPRPRLFKPFAGR